VLAVNLGQALNPTTDNATGLCELAHAAVCRDRLPWIRALVTACPAVVRSISQQHPEDVVKWINHSDATSGVAHLLWEFTVSDISSRMRTQQHRPRVHVLHVLRACHDKFLSQSPAYAPPPAEVATALKIFDAISLSGQSDLHDFGMVLRHAVLTQLALDHAPSQRAPTAPKPKL
jgi:hypothetical protein